VTRKPKTIDEYLATVSGDRRAALDGSTLGNLAEDLEGCGGTKSSLHFNPRKPLPRHLVRKLIRARIAEMSE
jgi:hypothetical protein